MPLKVWLGLRALIVATLTSGCVTNNELNTALDRDGDGYQPIVAGGPDCDETRADVNPGAEELCGDDIDNNCDGRIDDVGVGQRTWYRDVDGDGHGIDETVAACTRPEGYAPVPGDCDDNDPSIQPDAEDLCDGVDQDCDGIADDDASDLNQFRDDDGDGFGQDDEVVTGCGLTPGYVLVGGDCDDTAPGINPASEDVCDGIDQNCNGLIDEDVVFTVQFEDADGDGDGNPYSTIEACTNLSGYVSTSSDCDDTDPTVHSQAFDFCDGIDQDCDQLPDDDVTFLLYYLDEDGDGVGTGFAAAEACAPIPGHAPTTGDCDDHNFDINPLVTDGCDGVDSDCDGTIDEDALLTLYFPDADGDGIGSTDGTAAIEACIPPPGHVLLSGDCDDHDPSINPNTNDDCDGVDSDCDGTADDDAAFELLWTDADGDGSGTGSPVLTCSNPPGHAPAGGDCDDGDPTIRPGATDFCDGIDQDCDGAVDEDAAFELLWPDADSDGIGAGASVFTCNNPADHAPIDGDCDDQNPSIRPGIADLCDGSDQDCDGAVDEDASFSVWFPDLDGDGAGANGQEVLTCDGAPTHYIDVAGDCDDSNSSVILPTWWTDSDGDGFGALPSVQQCNPPANHVADSTDCDDADPQVSPSRPEVCNNHNNDDCDENSSCRPASFLTMVDADVLIVSPYNKLYYLAGDLNGDGALDLRTAFTPDLEVFFNDGNDGFDFAQPDRQRPQYDCTALFLDLAGGPNDDLLCRDLVTQQVFLDAGTTRSVVINNVPAAFDMSYQANTPIGPVWVASAYQADTLLFPATAGQMFSQPAATLSNMKMVDTVDCDGQTNACIIASTPTDWGLLRIEGGSTYSANDRSSIAPGTSPFSALFDLNGDGSQDIVTMSSRSNSAGEIPQILLYPGPFLTSSSQTSEILYEGLPGSSLAGSPFADGDDDGLADWLTFTSILVGPGLNDTATIINTHYGVSSAPYFDPTPDVSILPPDNENIFPLGFTDWNGDGYQDTMILFLHQDPTRDWHFAVFFGSGQ